MGRSIKDRFANWRAAMCFGLAYCVAGYAALLLAEGSEGIAFVWPASGVAVAGLLLLRMPFRLCHLGLVAIGGFGLNVLFGNPVPVALGFATANVVECLIVARVACLGEELCGRFDNPRWSLRFLGASFLGSTASALIATAVYLASGAQEIAAFFFSWLSTVVLGILIIAPAIIEMARAYHEGRALAAPSFEKSLSLGAVFLSSAIAFQSDSFSLLFVPFVAVVFATFALRTTGAIAGLLVVAVTGTLATAYGAGPVLLVGGGIEKQVAFLQFYLLMILVCVLPIGSLLSNAQRDAEQLSLSNRLLAKAESLANVGHWHFEVGDEQVLWSAEVYRIHGRSPGNGYVSINTAIEAYHPDDRALVAAAVEHATTFGKKFQFEARILCADGSIRHVFSQGDVELAKGKPRAVFGVILDITEQKAAMQELKVAHRQAEESARAAKLLAETDQLTGVANRRRVMEELEGAIARADEHTGQRFSFAMVDIDDFKVINDTLGHQMGDQVLARVAQLAKECLREQDIVGRLGGEEFGFILRGANKKVAIGIMERVRKAVENECFDDLPGVSISIGLAEFSDTMSSTSLVQSADTALYAAKRLGKNQIQLAA